MPHIHVAFQALPPLRRAWFLDAEGRSLIQLQQEFFSFNWRKGAPSDDYPRFPNIYSDFEKVFSSFEKAVSEEGFGKIVAQQFQLSYVNHIDETSGLGKIKPHLAIKGPQLEMSKEGLSDPDELNWSTSYSLPGNLGHLKTSALLTLVPPKMSKSIRLEIGAAGMSDSRPKWFQETHDWICEVFVATTNPELHSIWEKI